MISFYQPMAQRSHGPHSSRRFSRWRTWRDSYFCPLSTCPTVITQLEQIAFFQYSFTQRLPQELHRHHQAATLAECVRAEPVRMRDEGAHTLTGTSKSQKPQAVTNFPAMLTGKPALQSPLALCQVFCRWMLGKSCPHRWCYRAWGSPECTNLRSYCRTSLRVSGVGITNPHRSACTYTPTHTIRIENYFLSATL